MAEPSASPLQLVSDHFRRATDDWHRIADELRVAFDLSDEAFLKECPATKFILAWMWELYAFRKRFAELFKRKKQPPLADDFTAAVALCLEQFLTARGHSSRVRSEETTHKKRGATRPDVSVRSTTDALVATVECKTQMGWRRSKWKEEYETRTASLLERYPYCTPYLCVLTERNFNSAEFHKSPHCGKQWFCLSKTAWNKPYDILHPIEGMFLAILKGLLEK